MDALRALRTPRVMHPFMLVLCPLLGQYSQNADSLPASVLIRPAAALLVATFFLWMALTIAYRDIHRAGGLASILVVGLLLTWGLLEDAILTVVPWLSGWPAWQFYAAYLAAAVLAIAVVGLGLRKRSGATKKRAFITVMIGATVILFAGSAMAPAFGRRAAWLIAMYLIALWVILQLVARYKENTIVLTRVGNGFGGVLFVLYVAVSAYYAAERLPHTPVPPLAEMETTSNDPADSPSNSRPDIYCIVLDGYPRSDVLRSRYRYNNLPFETALQNQGFQIAENSKANYLGKAEALAACFNLEYLSNLVNNTDDSGPDGDACLFLYNNSRLFQFVKERGYRILDFSTGLGTRATERLVDERPEPPRVLNEFELVFLNRTVLSRIMQVAYQIRHDNPAAWRYASSRKRVLYALDALPRLAQEKTQTPRFAVARLPVPAPPFLFARSGSLALPWGTPLDVDRVFQGADAQRRQAFLDQLHYVNTSLQRTIKQIIAESAHPPVIVVLSTPNFDADPRLAAANLTAVRLPPTEGRRDVLYDSISLVNVWRMVLNHVFGAALPRLPDRLVVSIPS